MLWPLDSNEHHSSVSLHSRGPAWLFEVATTLLTLQFELLASLLLRCQKGFRLFSLLTWELVWLLAYFLCDLYQWGIFSPSNTYSILLRPVHGVNCLLQVVIFPFYNTTSIKCAEPSWHLLGHLQAATGVLPCLRMWRWLAALGKQDGVIMYPTAQLVSCRTLHSLGLIPSLASCLAASPCCKAFKFRNRTLPMPWIHILFKKKVPAVNFPQLSRLE